MMVVNCASNAHSWPWQESWRLEVSNFQRKPQKKYSKEHDAYCIYPSNYQIYRSILLLNLLISISPIKNHPISFTYIIFHNMSIDIMFFWAFLPKILQTSSPRSWPRQSSYLHMVPPSTSARHNAWRPRWCSSSTHQTNCSPPWETGKFEKMRRLLWNVSKGNLTCLSLQMHNNAVFKRPGEFNIL